MSREQVMLEIENLQKEFPALAAITDKNETIGAEATTTIKKEPIPIKKETV